MPVSRYAKAYKFGSTTIRNAKHHVGKQIILKLDIPAAYRRELRQDLYYCQKYGIQEHIKKTGLDIPEETYRIHLLGKVNYVLQVHPKDATLLDARKWLCNDLTPQLMQKRNNP